MRYQVGSDYYFIHVAYTAGDSAVRMTDLFLPWQDELHEIRVRKLTCKEHHKVPGDWDDEKKYDGFIFVDEDGAQWNNQYPVASYGQIDTSRDRFVQKAHADEEIDGFDRAALWEAIRGEWDACNFIDGILRSLNPRSLEYLGDGEVEKIAAMEKFKDQVIEKLEKVSGKKVVIAPWEITRNDGRVDTVKAVLRSKLLEPAAAA